MSNTSSFSTNYEFSSCYALSVGKRKCKRTAPAICVSYAREQLLRLEFITPTHSASVETSRSTPSRVDRALPVERQMQAVLGEQDMRQRAAPARPRAIGRWRRRLGDRSAGATRELLARVLDHPALAWDQLQRLGHILAKLARMPPHRQAEGNG
jgi:hypothetical protein